MPARHKEHIFETPIYTRECSTALILAVVAGKIAVLKDVTE